jgi:hypothetical protein
MKPQYIYIVWTIFEIFAHVYVTNIFRCEELPVTNINFGFAMKAYVFTDYRYCQHCLVY